MRSKIRYFFSLAAILIVCTGTFTRAVLAEEYTATTMRLLRHEGSVEIEDSSGKARTAVDQTRFSTGETMRTGVESSASVGLDSDRIVSLDASTRVEFTKQANTMQMRLTEGTLFLDVKKKLRDNETLDIQTSTMAVGIRGTIVFLSDLQAAADDSRTVPSGSADQDPTGRGKAAQEDSFGQAQAVDPGALTEVLTPDAEKADKGRTAILGVLEGTAELTYLDQAGVTRVISVEAGNKATLTDSDEDGRVDLEPSVTPVTGQDVEGFVQRQLDADPTVAERVREAGGISGAAGRDIPADPSAEHNAYAAAGNWTYTATVTLVAQSASKLYDGQPLTRSGDVLVYGLPQNFSIRVNASGSRTDAGVSSNPVGSYSIYNAAGEDVTSHFKNIDTVEGKLVVDPAPITVRTASAQKTYDGKALTGAGAELTGIAADTGGQAPWRNTSYIISGNRIAGQTGMSFSGQETLYGVCGTILVHGTNPLTGETREIELRAGQKLTVYLNDNGSAGKDRGQTIEFRIEKIDIQAIPDDILRLYADNPDLMAQACADTGWDPELVKKRIGELPARDPDAKTLVRDGLTVDETDADNLMKDLTDVRITIDTDITNYNNRALGSEEAHYTAVRIDDSVRVTATGSQTDVGSSVNTYTIDWGRANHSNYQLREDLGTLTVTPAPLKVTTSSAEKMYDGTPLTSEEASITGLVNGETATVSATGSITDRGSVENTYSLKWGTAKKGNYALSADTGTLRVRSNNTPITFTAVSTGKTYDGKPLEGSSAVTIDGQPAEILTAASLSGSAKNAGSLSTSSLRTGSLPEGFRFTAEVSGSLTDAGSAEYQITSYRILDQGGEDVTDNFSNISTQKGTLTIEPAQATVTTGSASKVYDGTPLTSAEASITGLVEGETATVTATGSITEVGTADNTYRISWETAKKDNYILKEKLGTLEVTPEDKPEYGEVTFTAASASKAYDGKALTRNEVTAEGLPAGFTFTAAAEGSQTDAGTGINTVSSYKIFNEDGDDVTAAFDKITTVDGSLTVTPAAATVTTGSASKVYDGTPLTSAEASITGLVDGETAAVTATGSITEVGTAENTYTISWGTAKKDNYILKEKLGTLEVTPEDKPEYGEVTFTAASASKAYDGKALARNEVTAEGLPAGFTFTAAAEGSQTDAGTGINTVSSYKIFNEDGDDVTAAFDKITTVDGSLTVTPAAATVTTGSASRAYDGTPLTSAEASITGLVNGETAAVTATGSITEVGTAENTYTISWGTAKKDNYILKEKLGTLEVTPEDKPEYGEVTFTAASASKIYDGKALTRNEVTAEGLPAGFTFTAAAEGSQTDAGTGINTVSSYKIFNEDGDDVTAAFDKITTVDGSLTVTPAAATVTTGSASKVYDGTPLTSAEASITGLVDGETAAVTATGSITEVGTTENTYTISWETAKEGNYSLTEALGILEVTKNNKEITFTAASASKAYDGKALTRNEVTAEGLPAGFTFTAAAEGSQTDAGTGINTVSSYKIFNEDGDDVTAAFDKITTVDGSLTVTPAAATVTTGSASRAYDGTPLTSAEASITGLVDGETAAVTATGSITEVGTTENTYTISWGTAKEGNYSLTEALGILEVTKNNTEITFTAASASKAYDGKALTRNEVTAEGLPAGFTFTAAAEGSQTDVGTSANTVSSYKILDGNEKDVTASFTNFKTVDGTLTVTKNNTEIVFTTGSATKTYDGTALTDSTVTVEGLPSGLTGTASADAWTGLAPDAGTYTNEFTDMPYSFTDEHGNELSGWRYYAIKDGGGRDVTDYFTNVKLVRGTLTIDPAPLTIETGSASRAYDGTPLTDAEATITGLVNGETAAVTATGTITDAGTAENTCSITWGTAKAANYTLTEKTGTLEVTPLQAEFDMNCYEADFAGAYFVPDGINGTYGDGSDVELEDLIFEDDAKGYPVHVTAVFNLTGGGQVQMDCDGVYDAGTYTMTPDLTFKAGKSDNYDLTFTNNTMKINRMPVDFLYGWSVDYDGNFHGGNVRGVYLGGQEYSLIKDNDSEWTIEGYSPYTDEKIFIRIDGGGKEPGDYTLKCTCSFKNDDPENYVVNASDEETLTIRGTIISEPLGGFLLVEEEAADETVDTPAREAGADSPDKAGTGEKTERTDTADETARPETGNEASKSETENEADRPVTKDETARPEKEKETAGPEAEKETAGPEVEKETAGPEAEEKVDKSGTADSTEKAHVAGPEKEEDTSGRTEDKGAEKETGNADEKDKAGSPEGTDKDKTISGTEKKAENKPDSKEEKKAEEKAVDKSEDKPDPKEEKKEEAGNSEEARRTADEEN